MGLLDLSGFELRVFVNNGGRIFSNLDTYHDVSKLMTRRLGKVHGPWGTRLGPGTRLSIKLLIE